MIAFVATSSKSLFGVVITSVSQSSGTFPSVRMSNDFISYIGNVEGTIIEKSSYSTKYVWVSTDGGYLNGTFSSSSGNCTFASGMIK